jgi:hypothetical protein
MGIAGALLLAVVVTVSWVAFGCGAAEETAASSPSPSVTPADPLPLEEPARVPVGGEPIGIAERSTQPPLRRG